MAITNWGELKTAVQNWSARSDTSFVERFPEFLALAEQRIYWGMVGTLPSEPLRVRDMEECEDLDFVDGEADLPTRFLEAERMYWDGDPKREMQYVPRAEFHATPEANSTGEVPTIFTTEGQKVLIAPPATGTGSLLFLQKYPSLSDDSDTNWIFTEAVGILLHAMLIEVYGFSRNTDEQTRSWASFKAALEGMNASHRKAKSMAGTPSPRARTAP